VYQEAIFEVDGCGKEVGLVDDGRGGQVGRQALLTQNVTILEW
jgi:hypothetical protein